MKRILFSLSLLILATLTLHAQTYQTIVNNNSGIGGGNEIAIDASGNLFVSDAESSKIYKVTPSGNISTFVSSIPYVRLDPRDLVFDASGNLYVANWGINNESALILKITPSGEASTFVSTSAGLQQPHLAIDVAGNVYATTGLPSTGYSIKKITPAGVISTLVSSGLTNNGALTIDALGNLYMVPAYNGHNIIKITSAGAVSNYASLSVPSISDIIFDSKGNLYAACDSRSIYKITPSGGALFVIELFSNAGGFCSNSLVFNSAGDLFVSGYYLDGQGSSNSGGVRKIIFTPKIDYFNPITATTGATITISGANFTAATGVSFGGTPASSFTVVNDQTITAIIGDGTSGDVSVTTPKGIASLGRFTYAYPVPSMPGPITGRSAICSDRSYTYSVSDVSGATSYTWALPSGWSGSSSTNSITITPGTTGGTISVKANNNYGSSSNRTLSVSVNTIPVVPPDWTVTGPVYPTMGSTQTYTVAPVANATYYGWSLPAGWTGNSTTNSIIVTVGSNSGNIMVTANNTCGNTLPLNYPVNSVQLPVAPATASVNVGDSSNSIIQGDYIITTLAPSGDNPVAGNVTATVNVDEDVQEYNSQPYVQRHYDIEPETNASAATATITLYFSQTDFNAYNSYISTNSLSLPLLPTGPGDAAGISHVIISQYHGTGTVPGSYSGTTVQINPNDNNVVWSSENNWWEVTIDVTGFSGFYLSAGDGSALPLHLLSFTATSKNSTILLQWKAANNDNSRGFNIERSSDGNSFSNIGYVAAGTGQTYSYTDIQPLTGKNYYRLKQLNNDGKYSYSDIVSIEMMLQTGRLQVFPNPSANEINIAGVTAGEKIQIFDNAGKLVEEVTATANQIKLNISALPAGVYRCKAGKDYISFIKIN